MSVWAVPTSVNDHVCVTVVNSVDQLSQDNTGLPNKIRSAHTHTHTHMDTNTSEQKHASIHTLHQKHGVTHHSNNYVWVYVCMVCHVPLVR